MSHVINTKAIFTLNGKILLTRDCIIRVTWFIDTETRDLGGPKQNLNQNFPVNNGLDNPDSRFYIQLIFLHA